VSGWRLFYGKSDIFRAVNLLVWLHDSGLGSWVRESLSIWSYPTILTLHTVGLALVAGLSMAVDLRILGVARRAPLAPMASFFPVMWAGFWLSAVSGIVLFVADAPKKAVNPAFQLKLAFVAVAVILLRRMQRTLFGARPSSTPPSEMTGKVLAAASLISWLGAIVAGRLIAYWGENR